MKSVFVCLRVYYKAVICVVIFAIIQIIADLTLPGLMASIIDVGISNSDVNYILSNGVYMLVMSLISAGGNIFSGFFAAKAAAGVGRDLRLDMFKKTEGFSLAEFDVFGTASLINRTTNDITQIQTFLVMALRMVITAPLMCIGGVLMAVRTNPQLSIILAVSMPFLVLLILIIGKLGVPLFKVIQKKLDRLNLIAREHLSGVRVIKAFITTDYETKRFDESNKDLTKISVKAQRILGFMGPGIMIILNMSLIAVMWIGSKKVGASELEIGQILAFGQYVIQITLWLMLMSMILIMYPRASVSAKRISDVLNTEYIIKIDENPKDVQGERGYLKFEDVSFSYPNAQEPAIKNISFESKPGETTAIIGSTGSGKSTVVNLIPRFYDTTKGKVLVNGVDVRDYAKEKLCDQIGYIPQKGILFSGTIAENIRYGKSDATLEEIQQACEIAQAMDFINKKEEKFDTHISQGGTNVSGGQKQRLSIARALVGKPAIYIFDDSFSALDFKTDAKLRKRLKEEITDATIIIVAQRISSITEANQIIVLDDGEMVGKGTHKELLASCSVYKEIAESQLSEEELKNATN